MKKNIVKFIIHYSLFLLSILANTIASAALPTDSSLAPMLQTILPSVVNIKAQIKITDFNTYREMQKQRARSNGDNNGDDNDNAPLPTSYTSLGSGVIVDAKNAYILTNAHVVANAQAIAVTLADGRHFTAKIIGLDRPSDIALLQIKAKNLTAMTLGNSNELKVGDFVAAIGNPFGLNQSVTSGIVSALGRTTLGIENYENFIQTDAPINPGNSGGALINMKGHLIGINTAILAPDRGSIGIGFAIPSNMAKSVMLQLIEYGNVKRGVLGIGAQDITPELANAFNMNDAKGAAVTFVQPESPAQLAGMEVGDIITSVNGVEIKNASDVINTIGFVRVNSKIIIDVIRNKKPLALSVTLSDPKKRKVAIEKMDPFLYGVALKNFKLYSPIHGNVQGVLVVAVEEDSKSWQSDLRPGDVITSANQEKIIDMEHLKSVIAKADKTLLLNVLRGPSAIFLVINKEES